MKSSFSCSRMIGDHPAHDRDANVRRVPFAHFDELQRVALDILVPAEERELGAVVAHALDREHAAAFAGIRTEVGFAIGAEVRRGEPVRACVRVFSAPRQPASMAARMRQRLARGPGVGIRPGREVAFRRTSGCRRTRLRVRAERGRSAAGRRARPAPGPRARGLSGAGLRGGWVWASSPWPRPAVGPLALAAAWAPRARAAAAPPAAGSAAARCCTTSGPLCGSAPSDGNRTS